MFCEFDELVLLAPKGSLGGEAVIPKFIWGDTDIYKVNIEVQPDLYRSLYWMTL